MRNELIDNQDQPKHIKRLIQDLAQGNSESRISAAEQFFSLLPSCVTSKLVAQNIKTLVRALKDADDPDALELRMILSDILIYIGKSDIPVRYKDKLVQEIINIIIRQKTHEYVTKHYAITMLELLKVDISQKSKVKMVDAFVYASVNGAAPTYQIVDEAFKYYFSANIEEKIKGKVISKLLSYIDVNNKDIEIIRLQLAAAAVLREIAYDRNISPQYKDKMVYPFFRAVQNADEQVRWFAMETLRYFTESKNTLTPKMWSDLIISLTDHLVYISKDELILSQLKYIFSDLLRQTLEPKLHSHVNKGLTRLQSI